MMKTWVVTGGAASGKSFFCRLLAESLSGIVVFSSDEAVHKIYKTPGVAAEIKARLGHDVADAEGLVSRTALRKIAFSDPEVLKSLEEFLHPRVYEALCTLALKLREEREAQLLIAEVPLFYESGSDFAADAVIVVAAQAKLQHERMTGERGLNADTAQRILDLQLPLRRKLELADKVVWNEGSVELLQLQAQLLLQQLVTPNAK